jgi:type IV pilus assembly protein PilM
MARSSIGLDVGTRAVRLAEVQATSGGPILTRFGRILLPFGAVDHGEIQDAPAVANAITTLWKRLGLTGKSVHVGMANRKVIVRVIELPVMSREDLAGAIRFQAQEHIPIPLAEAVMDFEILEEVEHDDGERTQRVLVVAAERSTIEPILSALRTANLEASTLELNAYPLVRCFGDGSAGAEAIVDVGAGVTNVVVHQDGKIRFTRILPTFGGDEFTNAIAQGLAVERDEAEILKRRASALLRDRAPQPMSVGARLAAQERPGPRAPTRAANSGPSDVMEETSELRPGLRFEPGPEVSVEDGPLFYESAPAQPAELEPMAVQQPGTDLERAAAIIEPLLERLVTEVRGSLDFYSSQPGARPIDRVLITGGGALMGGVAEQLRASLGTEVEKGHPFDKVPIADIDVTPEERAVAEPFVGVAVGLALAGMGV